MKTSNKAPSKLNVISIWGYEIPNEWLSIAEVEYLKKLPNELPTAAWVCEELDSIWNEQKLDNHLVLNQQSISSYYGHPVWLMNGIFSVCDPTSFSHRIAIAKYLGECGMKLVADYGGGFGQLALSLTEVIPDAEIYIVEPYPSKVGVERLRNETRIKIVSSLSDESYEAIVAQDVLEHMEDPIKVAIELVSSVRIGGKVIFANCFYPVIQCHLPKNFYLRHTFPFVMRMLGLRYIGRVDGAEHALVFERAGEVSISKVTNTIALIKLMGSAINKIISILSAAKHRIL